MSMTVHIFTLVHFCTAIVHDEGVVTVHIFMLAHFCTASYAMQAPAEVY